MWALLAMDNVSLQSKGRNDDKYCRLNSIDGRMMFAQHLHLCTAYPAEQSKHHLIEAEMFCFMNISPVQSNADCAIERWNSKLLMWVKMVLCTVLCFKKSTTLHQLSKCLSDK